MGCVDNSIPVTKEVVANINVIFEKHIEVNRLWLQKIGKPLELPSKRAAEFDKIRDVYARWKQFRDKARMTSIEFLAFQNYAEYLVETFHDLIGTPEESRPKRAQYTNSFSRSGW